MRIGGALVALLMVAYGLAALLGLTIWFPLTGSTPDWFPTLKVALVILISWVAVYVALGRRWALLAAVALSLVALVWTATWLAETLPPWSVKVIAVGVPLTVVAHAVTVAREARRRSQHHTA